jgi:hypothetical protein
MATTLCRDRRVDDAMSISQADRLGASWHAGRIRALCVTQEEHDGLCARPELQSVGAAVQLLTSSAHELAYAACWTCAPIVAGGVSRSFST